jgi:integrase
LSDGEHVQKNTKQGNPRTARQIEAAHRTALAKDEVGITERKAVPTLKAFAQDFINGIEVRNADKPETIRFYKGKLARLLAYEPLASARLDRIDEPEIETYIQHRFAQVSATTVNRELATLRRLLNLAKEWKRIQSVPRVKLLKGEKERTFVLSYADEQNYLQMAPQPLRDAATLMLDTGLRVGELVRLQWSDIHLQPIGRAIFGYLQVRSGKSKNAKRTIPLTARVRAMLEARRDRESFSLWVFPGDSTDAPILVTSLDHLHAKVARPTVKGKRLYRFSKEFVLHSLRHTMLTRLGEAGSEAFTIMKIAGHSSVTVSQRYVHPTPEAVERAFQRLETLNAQGGQIPALAQEIRQLPATVSATFISELPVSA